jgi:hypothetical protein
MAQNDSEKITYGFDKGSPVGDYSSLAIKKGSRVYLFSGEEADAITAYKDKAVEEVLDRLEPLTHEGRGTIAWEMDNMSEAIEAERNRLKGEKE